MNESSLRDHLLYLLHGGGAHLSFEDAIKGLPAALRGRKVRGLAHTAWQVLEHMRLAQFDILDFCRNPNYKEMKWPEDYWPKSAAPPTGTAWAKSVASFRADMQTMQALISDPAADLFAQIPWGNGQTLLREALLVADHNAYHLGELIALRRLLGAWKG